MNESLTICLNANCSKENEINAKVCKFCGGNVRPYTKNSWENASLPQMQSKYKVFSMKDRFIGGKFDPQQLESALNSYAEEGWELREAVTADIPGLGGSRNEVIFILENSSIEKTIEEKKYWIVNGVLILQKDIEGYSSVGKISTVIDRQNALPTELREKMAAEALAKGANCIFSYRSEQTRHNLGELINPTIWDTESLVGHGELAYIASEEIDNFLSKIFGKSEES